MTFIYSIKCLSVLKPLGLIKLSSQIQCLPYLLIHTIQYKTFTEYFDESNDKKKQESDFKN